MWLKKPGLDKNHNSKMFLKVLSFWFSSLHMEMFSLGVNFTNILCAPFCMKVLLEAFLYFHVRVELFWCKNIGTNALIKCGWYWPQILSRRLHGQNWFIFDYLGASKAVFIILTYVKIFSIEESLFTFWPIFYFCPGSHTKKISLLYQYATCRQSKLYFHMLSGQTVPKLKCVFKELPWLIIPR